MNITEEIQDLKREKNAVILAHYYVNPEIQEIADYIGDSYYLSKVAVDLKEQTIVFCGVSFMGESAKEGGPETWKHLSVRSTSRPRLVFHAQKRLRECVANKTVRGKLARALRDNFHSSYVEQIDFYHDFAPYSFFFQEVRNARDGICGGLIFHDHQNDLKKASYSVHT